MRIFLEYPNFLEKSEILYKDTNLIKLCEFIGKILTIFKKANFPEKTIFSDRHNARSTIPIRLIFGYVVHNGDLGIISKNEAFLANTNGATKNADISVRIGDFPNFFIYVVHLC